MKKVMMLGAGALQVPAIRKLKELGCFVIAADYDRSAPGFRYADACLPVSTLDQDGIYRQAFLQKPDVVMTSASDGPVYTAACVCRHLGLRYGLTPEDALCATNKALMRLRLKESGVPVPKFCIVDSRQEFRNAVARFEGPCVVKPADNAGSRGVRLLDRSKSEGIDETYDYSKSFSRSGTVLVEEFLHGPEVSVESFTVNGKTTVITVTDKLVSPPPFFVEIGHTEPSRLDRQTLDAVRGVARQAIDAIRIQDGPSHTEVKITEDGPKIVEIAARLGGDFITSDLVPLSTGVDMVGNSVLQALGKPVDLSVKFSRGAAVRFFTVSSGILTGIEGVDDVKKTEGVRDLVFYKKVGDRVGDLESSDCRIGHILVTADTADRAAEICEKAKACIRIELTVAPPQENQDGGAP